MAALERDVANEVPRAHRGRDGAPPRRLRRAVPLAHGRQLRLPEARAGAVGGAPPPGVHGRGRVVLPGADGRHRPEPRPRREAPVRGEQLGPLGHRERLPGSAPVLPEGDPRWRPRLGARRDSEETIGALRRFSMELSTDLAIFTVLTPFPGTEVHAEAQKNGWIEDTNYANYDMAHAIMPTETLARKEVQEQLYRCYRSFSGSIPRGVKGLFAKNEIKRRGYRHMAAKRVLRRL